jgi:hypothetical protein
MVYGTMVRIIDNINPITYDVYVPCPLPESKPEL